MPGSHKRRLSRLEEAAHGPQTPEARRYERLLARFGGDRDPRAGHAPDVAARDLIHAVRHETVFLHFGKQLLDHLDADVLAIMDGDGIEKSRLAAALRFIVMHHATTGAPLECPPTLARAWATHPTSDLSVEDTVRDLSVEERVGYVLSTAQYDCGDCGLPHPAVDASEQRDNGGWNIKDRPYFEECTLCGGRVGHAAFYNRHGHYPNGRPARWNAYRELLPDVTYPEEVQA